MTTVFINSKAGDITSAQEIPITTSIKLDASFVDMANYINANELSVLVQFEHQQLITLLNLTEVCPYVVLCFDADLMFKEAFYSIKSGTGNFTVPTQYKTLLFLRLPHTLQLNTLINLSHDSH